MLNDYIFTLFRCTSAQLCTIAQHPVLYTPLSLPTSEGLPGCRLAADDALFSPCPEARPCSFYWCALPEKNAVRWVNLQSTKGPSKVPSMYLSQAHICTPLSTSQLCHTFPNCLQPLWLHQPDRNNSRFAATLTNRTPCSASLWHNGRASRSLPFHLSHIWLNLFLLCRL